MAWLMLADVGAGGPSGPMAVVLSPSALPTPAADPGFSWSLLGPLSLILLLLLATLLVLRFVRTRQGGLRSEVLSVIAQTSLSPAHSLYVVQAGGRYLLLGGAPGGLSLLTELPASRLSAPAHVAPPDDRDGDDDDVGESEGVEDSPLGPSDSTGITASSFPAKVASR